MKIVSLIRIIGHELYVISSKVKRDIIINEVFIILKRTKLKGDISKKLPRY